MGHITDDSDKSKTSNLLTQTFSNLLIGLWKVSSCIRFSYYKDPVSCLRVRDETPSKPDLSSLSCTTPVTGKFKVRLTLDLRRGPSGREGPTQRTRNLLPPHFRMSLSFGPDSSTRPFYRGPHLGPSGPSTLLRTEGCKTDLGTAPR